MQIKTVQMWLGLWECVGSALRKRKAHQVSKVPLLLRLAAREPGEVEEMHWLAIRLPARSQWLGYARGAKDG